MKPAVSLPDPETITEAMNAVCDAVGPEADPFAAEAARRILSRVEWSSPRANRSSPGSTWSWVEVEVGRGPCRKP